MFVHYSSPKTETPTGFKQVWLHFISFFEATMSVSRSVRVLGSGWSSLPTLHYSLFILPAEQGNGDSALRWATRACQSYVMTAEKL